MVISAWVFLSYWAVLAFACPEVNANISVLGPHVVMFVYHRLASTVGSTMTIRIQTSGVHLQAIETAGYRIVPLADIVYWHGSEQDALPTKAVAITVGDGHRSMYETLWPTLHGRGIPMTLLVYPSAILSAPCTMTWPQLQTLTRTGQSGV